MKITLQFLADKAHVSRSLVSKVLNGKPVRVSTEKRSRILKLAVKYAYHPTGSGAGTNGPLSQLKRSHVIGFIQPSLEFLFLTQLTNAVEHYAQAAGYQVLLLNSHENVEDERRCLEICSSGMMEGVILNPTDNMANLEYCRSMLKMGLPMVFTDRYLRELECSRVTTDNQAGAYELTEELIKRGHRNILFVFHGQSVFTTAQMERFEGYQRAMADHGLDSVKEYIYSDRDLAHQPIYQTYGGGRKFTAVMLATSWDMGRIQELLTRIGGEIVDVAAFDSFSMIYPSAAQQNFSHCFRNVLIMEQNPDEMGKRTVALLVNEMKGGANTQECVCLKPKLLLPINKTV